MMGFSFDAKKTVKGKFKPSAAAERQFYRQLKKVAQASGHIVESHTTGAQIRNMAVMQKQLKDYSEQLGPWAERQSAKMLAQVQNSNKRAYQAKSKQLGQAMRKEVSSPRNPSERNEVGALTEKLLREQVALIKSIPLEAGQRAQKIALEAALQGGRAAPDQGTIKSLQEQLGLSTEVATSRALLIARTETARSNAAINEARAVKAGASQYRWHNSGDADVRHSHKFYKGKPLQGRIFSWDNPPTLSDGMTGHPGTFPNCRCFAEPVFDDE